MMLPQPIQRPSPLFFGPGGVTQGQTPLAQAQPPQPDQTQQPGGANQQLLEALRARQAADSMAGSTAKIQAQNPYGAIAQGLSGGLEGWAQSHALEAEQKQKSTSDAEINSALSSDNPLEALSKAQSPEAQAAYRQLRLEDVKSARAQEAAQKEAQFENTMGIDRYKQTTGADAAANRANALRLEGMKVSAAQTAAGAKPLPQRVQSAEDDDISAIQTTQSINTQLNAALDQIKKGDLELGPVNNFVGGIQNSLGVSTANSRNLASFQSTLEKIRNDSLRLNKGVQTEGDAIRAWNEVTKSINDPAVVSQQLERIKALNELAAKQRLQTINVRRLRNNAEPFDPQSIAAPDVALPSSAAGPTQEDLEFTAKKYGITVDEVKRRLGGK